MTTSTTDLDRFSSNPPLGDSIFSVRISFFTDKAGYGNSRDFENPGCGCLEKINSG